MQCAMDRNFANYTNMRQIMFFKQLGIGGHPHRNMCNWKSLPKNVHWPYCCQNLVGLNWSIHTTMKYLLPLFPWDNLNENALRGVLIFSPRWKLESERFLAGVWGSGAVRRSFLLSFNFSSHLTSPHTLSSLTKVCPPIFNVYFFFISNKSFLYISLSHTAPQFWFLRNIFSQDLIYSVFCLFCLSSSFASWEGKLFFFSFWGVLGFQI